MSKELSRSKFFFCYNKRLFTFINEIKGIEYITIAKHPTTNKEFGLFIKNEELQKAIDDYKVITTIST